MSDAAERTVDQLIDDLGSDNGVERENARTALVQIGPAVVPRLLQCLDAPQQRVRWEAAKSLAKIADPSTVERLFAAMADDDADVRWVVGEALAGLGHAAVKPLLMTLLETDVPDRVGECVHHVLHDLAQRGDLAPLLGPVVKAFNAHDPGLAVPLAAAEALQKYSS